MALLLAALVGYGVRRSVDANDAGDDVSQQGAQLDPLEREYDSLVAAWTELDCFRRSSAVAWREWHERAYSFIERVAAEHQGTKRLRESCVRLMEHHIAEPSLPDALSRASWLEATARVTLEDPEQRWSALAGESEAEAASPGRNPDGPAPQLGLVPILSKAVPRFVHVAEVADPSSFDETRNWYFVRVPPAADRPGFYVSASPPTVEHWRRLARAAGLPDSPITEESLQDRVLRRVGLRRLSAREIAILWDDRPTGLAIDSGSDLTRHIARSEEP